MPIKCNSCDGYGHILIGGSGRRNDPGNEYRGCGSCAGTGESPVEAISQEEHRAYLVERFGAEQVEAVLGLQ